MPIVSNIYILFLITAKDDKDNTILLFSDGMCRYSAPAPFFHTAQTILYKSTDGLSIRYAYQHFSFPKKHWTQIDTM